MSKKITTKPTYYLFIPQLLSSLNDWYRDFLFEVKAPNLCSLLMQTQFSKHSHSNSLYSAFFQTLYANEAEIPAAFYRYQVQNQEKRYNLICADPVFLEVSMNDVTLTEKITDLTTADAQELTDILNQHFAQDGLQFLIGSNEYWYVSYAGDEDIYSHDIDSVFQQNVTGKLIHCQQRNWKVIQNEIQMLLHSAEINQQREKAGLKPVNSLWFWGAGKPQKKHFEVDKVYSSGKESSKLRGEMFAKAAACEWQQLPKDFSSLLNATEDQASTQVLLLDHLYLPAIENRLEDFQEELDRLDKQIIKPLLTAWKEHKIEIVIDCCDGKIFKPEKIDFWKIWRKERSLRELAG